MKVAPVAAGIAVVLAVLILMAHSNSVRVISIGLIPGDRLEERRARLIEFVATHDWPAELAAAGISLPRSVEDQLLEPLLAREAGEIPHALSYRVEVKHKGIDAFFPNFPRSERAAGLIRARLDLESDLLDASWSSDPERRASRLWDAYGSGFDDRLAEFIEERLEVETDPEVRALLERLRGKSSP